MNFNIRNMIDDDWHEVKAIYKEGILNDMATFETTVPAWGRWNKLHFKHSRLVGHFGKKLIGWSALSPVSERACYSGVAEVSVYILKEFRNKGYGIKMLLALIAESEKNKIWTLQASIFKENVASLKLHQRCGFRKVGVRKKIGKLRGIWHDVCLLEKRSNIVNNR